LVRTNHDREKEIENDRCQQCVKKVEQKEGRTIGNARLTWKATGEDTGYATALYEMDLNRGVGDPVA
jgi:hypothetical protein